MATRLYVALAGLLFLGISAAAQNRTVSGTVRDETGEVLAGASVIAPQSRQGTICSESGEYKLEIKAEDSVIQFDFLGYESLQVPVGRRTVIDVTLTPDASNKLQEVVVIGYGVSKKGDLTGSVSVVDMDEMHRNPATNAAQSLQGRIAGAEFSSGTGETGEDGSIRIRGTRSLSATNEPLIIVDGIMDAVSSLSDLNPADITGISVLKDVSSTAIYGARGANGVILVSTTPAKSKQKISIKFSTGAGIKKLAGGLDLMDATELAGYRNMVRSAAKNFDPTLQPLYPDPTVFGKGTDWVEALTRTGVYQDHYFLLTGRTDAISYAASIGYTDEKGILIASGNKRLTAVWKIDAHPWSGTDIGIRTSLTDVHTDQSSAAVTGTSSNAAVYLSPLLDTSSTWNKYGADEDYGGTVFNNPYIVAQKSTKYKERDILSVSPYLKHRFGKHLNLDLRYTLNRTDLRTYKYSPSDLPAAAYNNTGGSGARSLTLSTKHSADATLTYKNTFKFIHSLEGLAGATFEHVKTDYDYLNVSGVLNDKTGVNAIENYWDPGMASPKSYFRYVTRMSGFARVNYVYDRRYHLSATLRADGASNFAENKKWGFFPAVAARWSIVNEKWLRGCTWINDLSLRLSAGRSGNDSIDPYSSLAVISSTFGSWIFGDAKVNATYPLKLANTGLTWETTDAVNAGVNFDTFHNRLSLEADAYLSYTHGLLIAAKTGYVTGYGSYLTNAGSTRNTGIELSIKGVGIKRKNFTWSTAFTLAHNSQIVTDAAYDGLRGTYTNPRDDNQYIYGYKTGYPRNSLWGYQYCGLWKDEAEFNRNLTTHTYVSGELSKEWSSNIGRARYLDLNHDGILDNGDSIYLGCSDPVVCGGLQNTFRINRKLELGVWFTYSLGGVMYNISEVWLGAGGASYNHYRYMSGAWTPDNPDSNIPRADRKEIYCSDTFVHDASFLRLKTLSVSYDYTPPKKLRKYVRTVNFSLSGENLLLWKKYNGFDPDVDADPSVAYRLDTGTLPRARSVMGKISVSF